MISGLGGKLAVRGTNGSTSSELKSTFPPMDLNAFYPAAQTSSSESQLESISTYRQTSLYNKRPCENPGEEKHPCILPPGRVDLTGPESWSWIAVPHISDKTIPETALGSVGSNPRGSPGSLLAHLCAGRDGRVQAGDA